MDVPVKNQKGDTVDTIVLDDAVYNVPMNSTLVHQALVIYQGNQRQGTHDTKTRGEVSGGGRKPWIQKHTGRARQGSTRAPQWRHGGVVFGPHPRSYRKVLPRRMRRQAVKCVLSEKARRGHLLCIDSLAEIDGKTKSMVTLLENLGVSGSALVVTEKSEPGVVRAAHNLTDIWTLPVNLLNANDLLRRQTLIMTVAAARKAEEMWAGVPSRGLRRASGTAGPAATSATAGTESTPSDSGETSPAAPGRRRRRATGSGGEEATE
jgi:large subunit ribosomal protein L4